MKYIYEKIHSWTLKDHLKPFIFERGLEYYENKKLKYIHRFKDLNTSVEIFKSKIKGSNYNEYDTYVVKERNDFKAYYCSCPCDFICKHVVALYHHTCLDKSYQNIKTTFKRQILAYKDIENAIEVIKNYEGIQNTYHEGSIVKWSIRAENSYDKANPKYLPPDLAQQMEQAYASIVRRLDRYDRYNHY